MSVDVPVVILIAVVALLVASVVARRAGEHADQVAGRRPVARAARRGPLGAVVDLLDESVAAYRLRELLGLSTRTRAERRAADERWALVARADEIRRLRTGAAPPIRPTHLVVSGRAGEAPPPAPPRRSSTLPFELGAAMVGLVLVVGIVVAIAPRETGGVLSATGLPGSRAPRVPASASPTIPTPTPSPTPSSAAAAS